MGNSDIRCSLLPQVIHFLLTSASLEIPVREIIWDYYYLYDILCVRVFVLIFPVALHHTGCIYCCRSETSCLVLITSRPWQQDEVLFYYWYQRIHTTRDCSAASSAADLRSSWWQFWWSTRTVSHVDVQTCELHLLLQDRAGCTLTCSCSTAGKVDWLEIYIFPFAMSIALSVAVFELMYLFTCRKSWGQIKWKHRWAVWFTGQEMSGFPENNSFISSFMQN